MVINSFPCHALVFLQCSISLFHTPTGRALLANRHATLLLASGHQQPSQLSVSRPMVVADCDAPRSSPQSISGPPSLRSPAAKWRRNPPPGADRHHRPSTCTTATQSMYVKLGAHCRCLLHHERLTFVPARARRCSADPQAGAAPPARQQQLQTAEVTTCHGTDVERTYIVADQGDGA